jgi:hypothetical protein
MDVRSGLLACALVALSSCAAERSARVWDEGEFRSASTPGEKDLVDGTAPSRELSGVAEGAPVMKPGFVLEQVRVRLGPTTEARGINTLYRLQRVDIHEIRDGWARISPFFEDREQDDRELVALWVPAESLSPERPRDLTE